MRDVAYLLGPTGPFATAFPGYEPRPGQVSYARSVEGTLSDANPDGRPLLIEGPTGVGKSFGYLLPAIANIMDRPMVEPVDGEPEEQLDPDWDDGKRRTRRVVVVTSNIALQEQIVGKDLPSIRKITGWQFNWVLLKGRSNYACHRAVYELEESGKDRLFDNDEPEVYRLREWFRRTRTGDKSEVDPSPKPAAWAKVSSTKDDCTGRKCPFFQECYYYGQRRAIRTAHVIVTNYSFLMTEIELRRDTGRPSVMLPEFDILICDEAHEMGEIARRFFATEVRASRFAQIGRLLNGHKIGLKDLAAKVWALGRDLDTMGTQHHEASNGSALYDPARYADFSKKVTETMEEVVKGCAGAWNSYRKTNSIPDWMSAADLPDAVKKDMEAILRPGKMAEKVVEDSLSVWPAAPEDGQVYYVEEERETFGNGGRKTSYSFVSCPFSCAGLLKEALWDHCERVILTSATLATSRHAASGSSRFQFVREDLGLDGIECYEDIVDSPFDYQRQMGVWICDVLDPQTAKSNEYAEIIARLLMASRGRALVLFTSYRQMEEVHAVVSNRIPYRCFKQGESSRLILTERFRADVSSCLFATRSFFQGIDIQGESLSLLVLDRVPFPAMNDPFIETAKKKGEKAGDRWGWFDRLSIPRALMLFRQATGRLIRSRTDTGVVAILDGRIATGGKGYGRRFRDALPSSNYLGGVLDVARFFGTPEESVTMPPTRVGAAAEPPGPPPGFEDDIPF